jgi:surface polysaccharide O-acyltransferase-like enzyme
MFSSFQRVIAFDVMRIIAIFAVIWLHFSSQRFYTSFPSTEWEIRNIYDSMVRWGVPVFVMISGALFLDSNKKLSIKKLYSKNILRIICAFLFWSSIYLLYDILVTSRQSVTLGGVISGVTKGSFHLWFLKMLLGLYIIAPILKIIANNKKIEVYFLLIVLLTTFLLPWFFKLLGFLNNNMTLLFKDFCERMGFIITDKLNESALGYIGYFMLGHYLRNKTFNSSIRKTIYILGLISWICVIIFTHYLSFHYNRADIFFYDYLSVFTLAEAIAIYTFINHRFKNYNSKHSSLIVKISNLTFGVYLIHILFRQFFQNSLGIDSYTIGVGIGVPVLSIITFICSLAFTWTINKIPHASRFII